MLAKVIKTEEEYEATMARIEKLMDAELGTAEGDELELLGTLVEVYEEKHYPIGLPDPIDAIRFRMEQAGLKQRDLVPYFGSPSKVSEVLSGRRSLSLKMIRALNTGLGIPAEALLHKPGATIPENNEGLIWDNFPIKEMLKRGWFEGFTGSPAEAKHKAEELVRGFIGQVSPTVLHSVRFRQHVRSGSQSDELSVLAWLVRLLTLAQQQEVQEYRKGSINGNFMRRLVSWSCMDEGPKVAQKFLAKEGIHMITERHLPKTYLDGAAMVLPSGNPVIGLTLRHDRLDNFWFCLCHELGHIARHREIDGEAYFVDDLESSGDRLEDEADKFAADSLIPPKSWEKSSVRTNRSSSAVREFAKRLKIHPAIVAGRIQREQSYKILSGLVGRGEVRKHFDLN